MNSITIILIALIFIVFLIVLYLLSKLIKIERNSSNNSSTDDKSLLLLQEQLTDLRNIMSNGLNNTHQTVSKQYKDMGNIVRDVTSRMSKIEEVSRQVLTETSELQKLQQILKNPKQRGVLGEYFLETLLKNILPPENFQMQYKFQDGEIVDAAVFIKDKIVPIDSKFSLENWNRIAEEQNEAEQVKLEKVFLNDLKNRIKETSKYIRPTEGTMDFAFMFIPHEAIYYDLLINKIGIGLEQENLIQKAASKYHVIIVSPTSFMAYLQTVLQGLRALKIEEQAKEIIKRVGELESHLGKYDGYLQNVGKHLTTTVNQYNLSYKEFNKIDKDVLRITKTSNNIDPLIVAGPSINRD